MSSAYHAPENQLSKYRDLLSKAVARLPRDAPNLRQDVYERARAALRRQLGDIRPPIGDVAIVAEERALNDAIERIEAGVKNGEAPTSVSQEAEADFDPAGGWLTDLLKRASNEAMLAAPPKQPPPKPLSVMDFAPVRAQIKRALSAPKPRLPLVSSPRNERRDAVAMQPAATQLPSRDDKLSMILRKFQDESPDVEASAIISEDGSMIASALAADMEATRIAGMAATLQNIGTRAATALARGKTREVIIRGKQGYAILISAGPGALLLALTSETSKLGLIFFNMHEVIESLSAAIETRRTGPE